MLEWIKTIGELEAQGIPFVLLTLISVNGSTPRDSGTKMVVTADKTYGTIGGGQLEYRAINQAERLLIVRRKKRMEKQQQMAQQNSQMQAQQQAQAAQVASQTRQQELQVEAQLESQKMQLKNELEMQLEQVKHQYRKEIELIRAQATLGFRTEEQEFKEKLEVLKEDRKDNRIKKESAEQSKLISQRQGKRGEMTEPMGQEQGSQDIDEILGL